MHVRSVDVICGRSSGISDRRRPGSVRTVSEPVRRSLTRPRDWAHRSTTPPATSPAARAGATRRSGAGRSRRGLQQRPRRGSNRPGAISLPPRRRGARAPRRRARARYPQSAGAVVHQVRFVEPSRARVRFAILLGRSELPFEGEAIREGDRWRVSRATIGQLLSGAGLWPPAGP